MREDVVDDKVLLPETKGGFDSMFQQGVANIMLELIKPWFERVLSKYDEAEFHRIIANGFDFRSDWLANHADTYPKIIKKARRIRWALVIDVDRFSQKQVEFLTSRGWTLTEHEIAVIRKAVLDVKNDIEGDHPLL